MKQKHGGRRNGAGRPRTGQEIQVRCSLPESTQKCLCAVAQSRGIKLSRLIREILIGGEMMFTITKWTKHITDDGKDQHTGRNLPLQKGQIAHKFRLLDDDHNIYAYGISTNESFSPLDMYSGVYGCTSIEYQNPQTGEYEVL